MAYFRQAKIALYSLKKIWGVPATIYKPPASTTYRSDGKIIRVATSLYIPRVIQLPDTINTRFKYTLAYIAANKNFTYGGHFDAYTKVIIVDKNDLTAAMYPTIQNWFEIDSKKYEIAELHELEFDLGYFINLKGTIANE